VSGAVRKGLRRGGRWPGGNVGRELSLCDIMMTLPRPAIKIFITCRSETEAVRSQLVTFRLADHTKLRVGSVLLNASASSGATYALCHGDIWRHFSVFVLISAVYISNR